jgi:F-type H+-transporting ATPase subunit b
MAGAVADAARERERLMTESRNEVAALRSRRQMQLQNDCAAQGSRITRLIADEVLAIARSALEDLAGADLEDRMAYILARRVGDMPPAMRASWRAALEASGAGTIVRSRYDLPASSKAIIRSAVNAAHPTDIPLQFETAAENLCGIELVAPGQKISWTLGDYLQSLQGKVDAIFQEGATAPPFGGHDAPLSRPT